MKPVTIDLELHVPEMNFSRSRDGMARYDVCLYRVPRSKAQSQTLDPRPSSGLVRPKERVLRWGDHIGTDYDPNYNPNSPQGPRAHTPSSCVF